MLDTHDDDDDGCDDLTKHEESFPHRTPSVQYFVVKVCLVVFFCFFLTFASAFTTENTLSEVYLLDFPLTIEDELEKQLITQHSAIHLNLTTLAVFEFCASFTATISTPES